jgi:hypothetical protein
LRIKKQKQKKLELLETVLWDFRQQRTNVAKELILFYERNELQSEERQETHE